MTDADITRLQLLATDPAVAYFIDTVSSRLQAGIVDRETYVDETRSTLERKRDAIAEALLAGELQEDQARHSTRVAEAQLTALELIDGHIDEALEEERFEIKVGLTGDTAEADSADAALAAADQLVRDAFDGMPTQGRTRAARKTILISRNGRYDGALTEIAKAGHVHLDALAEGRN